jgi:hypothetical protein
VEGVWPIHLQGFELSSHPERQSFLAGDDPKNRSQLHSIDEIDKSTNTTTNHAINPARKSSVLGFPILISVSGSATTWQHRDFFFFFFFFFFALSFFRGQLMLMSVVTTNHTFAAAAFWDCSHSLSSTWSSLVLGVEDPPFFLKMAKARTATTRVPVTAAPAMKDLDLRN